MKTLQTELVKYRQFVSAMRQLGNNKGEKIMSISDNSSLDHSVRNPTTSRVTARAANKRYKRTTEELDADIEKVDQLVASGKFNQIEALNHVGLQSSVYHYRKRQQREEPAKSYKPRKFTNRIRTKKADYEERKQNLLNSLEEKKPETDKAKLLEHELIILRAKYNKLKDYVVNNVILKE
jgi:hypothetical protein